MVTSAMPSPLIDAIRAQDPAAAAAALSADPGEAASADEDGVSAFLLALYSRQPAIADAILPHLRDLDVFEAAAAGRAESVRRLIANGSATANGYAADGFTPLGLAAFFQRRDVVATLLELGADPNLAAKNAIQASPLHSAAAGGPDLEIVRLLLDAGADPNVQQRHGFTPLHSAAHNGALAQVQLLIARGADVDAATDEGKTAVDYARERHYDEIVAALAAARVS